MLGEKIRELREKENYSQKELGLKLGISPSTIGMYEQNRRSPGKDMLLKITKIFNVSVDYLLSADTYNTTSIKENHNYKDVNDILKIAKEQLMNTEALLFNGEPATEEAIQSILDAMEMGMALAKEKNKKYTPNKYKK